jgi:hypothetical protein
MTISRSIAAVIFTASLCVAPFQAAAQVKPFSLKGSGLASHIPLLGDTAEHWSQGTATHLGKHRHDGARAELLSLTPLDPSEYYPHEQGIVVATGTFHSVAPVVFQGSGGGSLTFDYGHKAPGEVELIVVGADENGDPLFVTEWDAIFTLSGSGGRLAKAVEGEFRMIALSSAFGPEGFVPNPDWDRPGIVIDWHSVPGGWVRFRK